MCIIALHFGEICFFFCMFFCIFQKADQKLKESKNPPPYSQGTQVTSTQPWPEVIPSGLPPYGKVTSPGGLKAHPVSGLSSHLCGQCTVKSGRAAGRSQHSRTLPYAMSPRRTAHSPGAASGQQLSPSGHSLGAASGQQLTTPAYMWLSKSDKKPTTSRKCKAKKIRPSLSSAKNTSENKS